MEICHKNHSVIHWEVLATNKILPANATYAVLNVASYCYAGFFFCKIAEHNTPYKCSNCFFSNISDSSKTLFFYGISGRN